MDGSGPPLRPDGNDDHRKRKLPNDENTVRGEPRPSKTAKFDQPVGGATQMERNMSGVKSFLHGISYQIKLCIYVCLVNARRAMDPKANSKNKYSFEVKAEDPKAGKFDDIVYEFQDGDKKGTLMIQAKHSVKSPTPKITLKDLITNDKESPFSLQKYFSSFCDQKQSSAVIEGLIICTNWNIDGNANGMCKTVELAVTDDSTTSMDFYTLSLFESIGGKCYQLDYQAVWTTDGMFSEFQQLLRQCSKRGRLARHLIDAIKSKTKITCNNSLYKEYRPAILAIIDRNETSMSGQYGFTKDFLDSSFTKPPPSYEAFRKEFEEQYRNEFKVKGSVWDDLKLKSVCIAKAFMSDSKDESATHASFPDDNVDESFKSFCERFRLVCGTYNEQQLDDAIVEMWRNLHWDDNQLVADIEENMATERLFKTNFDWLMDPFAKPLDSNDIQNTLQTIVNDLAFITLKGISNNRRMEMVKSLFRIQSDILKDSDLYDQMENDSFVELQTYDVQFGTTVVSDILDGQGKANYNILFLQDSDFINNSKSVEAVFRSNKLAQLIIVCRELFLTVKNNVKKWRRDILKHSDKQVVLLSKSSTTCEELAHFRFNHLHETRSSFFNPDIMISLYNTTISPAVLFKHVFEEQSIEDIIRELDRGKQMEENNSIVKSYRTIENIYVQRVWIKDLTDQGPSLKRVWTNREEMLKALESICDDQDKEINFIDLTKHIKKDSMFAHVYGSINVQAKEVCSLDRDSSKKVMILLGEAGCGKSTNLTWLAWRTQKQNPSSWIILCKLPDYCTDFKRLNEDQAGHITQDIQALRVLYELIYLSFVDLRDEALQSKKLIARKCSECISFTKRKVVLSKELIEDNELSLDNRIHLGIFQEMFNASKLLLFFDGFDEIAPHYKEVVLNLLSWFAQFNGVNKLYVTSRPYNFKDRFSLVLERASYYQLKPLSIQEKGSILYKMLEVKLYKKHIGDIQTSDLYKALCVALLCHLGQMSDVTLNLMTSVDILVDLAARYINFSSKQINLKLFEEIDTKFRPSFIVDEFVKTKIRNSLYDKIGADKSAEANPREIERFEKAIDDAKLKHGLLGVWVLFDEKEREAFLSHNELLEAQLYMQKIEESKEKTGIIDRIQQDVPIFIHRTFAEYLAAWRIFVGRIKCRQPENKDIAKLTTFWSKERSELKNHVDTILAKQCPVHLAIIEGDLQTTKSMLSTNPDAFTEKDAGGRSILHLLACYTSFIECFNYLPAFVASDIVDTKDMVYCWTALDFSFQVNNECFAFYLMHQGASINADAIYEQVVFSGEDNIYRAAIYAKYVMTYLSREAIKYESHENYGIIKAFCDQAALFLANENSIDPRMADYPYYRMNNCLLELSENFRKMLNVIVHHDSVWMLESMIQHVDEQLYSANSIRNIVFSVALDVESVFVLKYCLENDSSLIGETVLRKCLEKCIIENYKNEFKWFFDCYCSRIGIQHYLPCAIHSDHDTNLICMPSYDDDIWKVVAKIDQIISDTASEIVIDENLHWLLVLIVASGRPSILRYLIVSCQLNLDADLIYYLARIIENYFKEVERHLVEFFIPDMHDENEAMMKRSMKLAFKTLLNQPSTLSDHEATEMFRLGVVCDFFDFLDCLVEYDGISFHAVDAENGWTAFHLCVSRSTDREASEKLFRSMFERTNMDCFGILDLEGRSVFHLALENRHKTIIDFIITRMLENINYHYMGQLEGDVLSNLIEYYYKIHEQPQSSLEDERYYRMILRKLAKQITKIVLSADEELSSEQARHRAILAKEANKLYQIAVQCSSLFLVNYLHRVYGCTIDFSINDEDWLACMAQCLNESNVQVFQWMIGQYKFCHRIANPTEHGIAAYISFDVAEKCEAGACDWPAVKRFMDFFKKAEEKVASYQSMEDVCIMRLVFFTLYHKHESATRFLCLTLQFTFDWKFLLDIIAVLHQLELHCYKQHCCIFDSPAGEPIYRHLFQCINNLNENDTSGRSLLHLAIELKLSCIIMLLIEYDIMQSTAINDQNGWNVIHYYAAQDSGRARCYTEDEDLVFTYLLKDLLENDETMMGAAAERPELRIIEICFNNTDGRKSVIDVALMTGNIDIVKHILLVRLGIKDINKHTILSEVEHAHYKECYNVINQIAAALPCNAQCEYLLHRLAKSIDNFALECITRQENIQDHVVEHARTALSYRSVSTLEYLIGHFSCEMCAIFEKILFSERELIVLMIECIRRHRLSLFKMVVYRYCTIKGILQSEVAYEEEKNEEGDEYTIDEDTIAWSLVQLPEDDPVDRNYLTLLIMLAAYGRLSMTKYFVAMLQPFVSSEWMLLLMKTLTNMKHSTTRSPVYGYLNSLDEDSDSGHFQHGYKISARRRKERLPKKSKQIFKVPGDCK